MSLSNMNRESPFMKGYAKLFGSPSEVRAAYDAGELHLQASIRCRIGVWDPHQNVDEDLPIRREIFATTTGRVLLSEIVPHGVPFQLYNKELGKKELQGLIDEVYRMAGSKKTVLLADALRSAGYANATLASQSQDQAQPCLNFAQDLRRQITDFTGQKSAIHRHELRHVHHRSVRQIGHARVQRHIAWRAAKCSCARDNCHNDRRNPALVQRIDLDHHDRSPIAGLGSARCPQIGPPDFAAPHYQPSSGKSANCASITAASIWPFSLV